MNYNGICCRIRHALIKKNDLILAINEKRHHTHTYLYIGIHAIEIKSNKIHKT